MGKYGRRGIGVIRVKKNQRFWRIAAAELPWIFNRTKGEWISGRDVNRRSRNDNKGIGELSCVSCSFTHSARVREAF